ncbi:CAT RNA binding domain-containing protein, partial [Klebsiella pneumoniae]
MQVAKILNNNQVICLDDNGKECIAVGKGLGFGVSVGDNIVTDKIEKCFSIIDEETQTKFGNDSNLLIVFYVQIMPDDFVMQL